MDVLFVVREAGVELVYKRFLNIKAVKYVVFSRLAGLLRFAPSALISSL